MAAALALSLSVQPPCACLSPAYAETVMPPASLHLGKFSGLTAGDELGAPWRALSFENIPRKTRYRLVSEVVDGRRITVLEARSEQSASGMVRDVDIDPREYPFLRWYWKVPRALAGSKIASKAGDDFAARVYVTFALEDDASLWERFKFSVFRTFYGRDPPGRALNYVWSADEPIGVSAPSPYTKRVHTIVVESGSRNLDLWTEETRNIVDDYRRAFGSEPPRVTGVGLMTDTDNTRDSATAYFGDLRLESSR